MEKHVINEVKRIREVMSNIGAHNIILEQDLVKMAKYFVKFSKGGRVLISKLGKEWTGKTLMKKLSSEFNVKTQTEWEDLLNKYVKGQMDEVPMRKMMVMLGELVPDMRTFLRSEIDGLLSTMSTVAGKSKDDFIVSVLNDPKTSRQFRDEWLEAFGTTPPLKTLKKMVYDMGAQEKLVVLWENTKGFFDKFKRTTVDDIQDVGGNAILNGLADMDIGGRTYMELQTLFEEKFSKIFNMGGMNMNYNSIEDLVEALSTAISKGAPFDSKLNEDLYKLIRTQRGPRKALMVYLRNSPLLRKQFRAGKLSDESIEELLGGPNFAKKTDIEDLKNAWNTKNLTQVITSPLTATWSGMKNIGTNLSFWKWFALTQVGSVIGSSIIQIGRAVKYTDKAMAGTHQDYYAQVRGAEDIVLAEGGLTDEQAVVLADRLYAMFQYITNNEDEITEWKTEHEELLISSASTGSIEQSITVFDDLVSSSGNVYVGNARYIFGTDDGSLSNFYKMPAKGGEVPTILAASQICYFYEEKTGKKDSLWSAFKSMQAFLTIIPVLHHLVDEGEEQITSQLDLKPWGFSVDKTVKKVAKVIQSFYDAWPVFPTNLKAVDENGVEFDAYTQYAGRIPIDYLADISAALKYTPKSNNQQEWLGKLSAEKFNTAWCTRRTAAELTCEDPYQLTKKEWEAAEKIELMDKEKFESATQEILNAILSEEQTGWLNAFMNSYGENS